MTPRIALSGDTLEPYATAITPTAETTDATCLVWLIDLTTVDTPRAARRRLKEHFRGLLAASTAHSGLRHVLVLYAHQDLVPARRVEPAARSIASRLHAEIERRRGRYVDVILLDVTRCEDLPLLDERIAEVALLRAGMAGDTALIWEDIRERSIHSVVRAERS